MGEERRRFPRYPIQNTVELTEGNEPPRKVRGINVSRSGLLCAMEKKLNPATVVTCQVRGPSDPADHGFECEGIVVRSEKDADVHNTGIKFRSISDEASDRLDAFLRANEIAAGDVSIFELPD